MEANYLTTGVFHIVTGCNRKKNSMIACGLQEPFTIINNYFFLKTLELYGILIPGLVLAKRPLICIKQSVLMLHASIGCE